MIGRLEQERYTSTSSQSCIRTCLLLTTTVLCLTLVMCAAPLTCPATTRHWLMSLSASPARGEGVGVVMSTMHRCSCVRDPDEAVVEVGEGRKMCFPVCCETATALAASASSRGMTCGERVDFGSSTLYVSAPFTSASATPGPAAGCSAASPSFKLYPAPARDAVRDAAAPSLLWKAKRDFGANLARVSWKDLFSSAMPCARTR